MYQDEDEDRERYGVRGSRGPGRTLERRLTPLTPPFSLDREGGGVPD